MTNKTLCDKTRRELLAGAGRVSGAAARHLDDCPPCAAFGERFTVVNDILRRHHTRAVADATFAARVTTALPVNAPGDDTLSWVALRLLPATLALALVLGAWSWLATSSPASLAEVAPTDDVLSWVLENGGGS